MGNGERSGREGRSRRSGRSGRACTGALKVICLGLEAGGQRDGP